MPDPAQILIVDDEPNVRLMFRTALEPAFAVKEAADGQTAVRAIRERPFDVVLLDLRMPGIDGMETLRLLKDARADVPVVVVSAHGSIPDVVEAMRLGAVDFIPKPLSPDTLRRVVRQALASERAAAAPQSRLGREAIERASQALERGALDEASVFLRTAESLGADPAAACRLSEDIKRLRDRRGVGAYRVLGSLTWG
jgi:DNA-binding NtrC family response regulator